jgi:hypothetical protein
MRVQGYKRLGRSQWLRCAMCGEKTKQDQTSRNEHEASLKHLQALQDKGQDTTRLSASSEHTLRIISLYDAQAECSCGKWSLAATGKRSKAEVQSLFTQHLQAQVDQRQGTRPSTLSPIELLRAIDAFWGDGVCEAAIHPGAYITELDVPIKDLIHAAVQTPQNAASGDPQQSKSWTPAKHQLYELLTAACQNLGDCNDETYEALHVAVDSIIMEDAEQGGAA